MTWTADRQNLIDRARQFYVGQDGAVGVLLIPGAEPCFLRSGEEGGPFGGTQRGGVPRLRGWAFTRGGQSQGNIATHVEGHAAAILWQRNIRNATLLVDRPMCDICSRFLPYTLPPGSHLLVVSRDEGETHVWASHGA